MSMRSRQLLCSAFICMGGLNSARRPALCSLTVLGFVLCRVVSCCVVLCLFCVVLCCVCVVLCRVVLCRVVLLCLSRMPASCHVQQPAVSQNFKTNSLFSIHIPIATCTCTLYMEVFLLTKSIHVGGRTCDGDSPMHIQCTCI